jgi:hypothetical protein
MSKQHPIATLETRATTASATAPAQAGVNVGKALTGQYLYDRFCASKADVSKMNIVESAVQKVGIEDFATALKDMIGIAEKHGDAAKKTAQNHAAVLKNVYGALKHCESAFKAGGYEPGKTGYHLANSVAKKVLKDAAIRWNGQPATSPEERQARARNVAEQKAMKEAAAQVERQEGESLSDYQARVASKAETLVEALAAEARAKQVEKLSSAVWAMVGKDVALLSDLLVYMETAYIEPDVTPAEPAETVQQAA